MLLLLPLLQAPKAALLCPTASSFSEPDLRHRCSVNLYASRLVSVNWRKPKLGNLAGSGRHHREEHSASFWHLHKCGQEEEKEKENELREPHKL